ncbi:enolase C-terminal domain-like protein [Acrocarpospora catenulata]|uniref:enolase C-terminal domain-like protein n=1 Tax=Acrocarpospora catenulata TaxID=2836182 RepID=UPI001BDA8E66|nr:enolase C-terminal domain-like protein [Acrocarpospora catenulata]
MTPIGGVEAAVYTVPTDRPEADGTLDWDRTTMVLVHTVAGGQRGIGWTYGPAACASVVVGELAPVVCGMDVFDIPAALAAMVRRIRNAGRTGVAGYAVSAVETSLWDLKARLLGLPLCSLLGQARPELPVYGSGGFTSYSDEVLQEQLIGWKDLPRVKIKIGRGRDLDRVRLARATLGPGTELFVDANGAYSAKEAIRIAHAMDDQDVRWFEEPVSSDDPDGLRQVRDAIRADVAAGEYGCDLTAFARLTGAVDCLQIDVTRCGGVLEWQRAAALAAAAGLQVSAHCAPGLHRHVALSVPNVRHAEWFHDHVRIESMFFDGFPEPVNGAVSPDLSRPGMGLELRGSDSERYRVK